MIWRCVLERNESNRGRKREISMQAYRCTEADKEETLRKASLTSDLLFRQLSVTEPRFISLSPAETVLKRIFEVAPCSAFFLPLSTPLFLSLSLLCNRSSSAHFKPKHVCLAPKQTGPPPSLSPVLLFLLLPLLPLPHQTPFSIQRDDVMPMLRKTRGSVWTRCVCVCVWLEGSHGRRGHGSRRCCCQIIF